MGAHSGARERSMVGGWVRIQRERNVCNGSTYSATRVACHHREKCVRLLPLGRENFRAWACGALKKDGVK